MLTLFSPAKLNLFFRVLGKRGDGYHEIASLYRAIDLCDTLVLGFSKGKDTLTCTDAKVPTDGSNLILRAAELFRKKTGSKEQFSFHLHKVIPMESGLGGGSSNAATALFGMSLLSGLSIDSLKLATWATELGSDVPFFFSQGAAFCEGRGEKLTYLPSFSSQTLWVARPDGKGLSTPLVYQNVRLDSLSSHDPQLCLSSYKKEEPIYFNDLEVAAFTLMPKLSFLKSALLSLGFNQVSMTGSGTAFFCLGEVECPFLEGVSFYKVRFLNRSEKNWWLKNN